MSDTTRVAFIGLGIMGSPMAVNLAKAGFDVVGFSRRRVSAEPLIAAGGSFATQAHEAVTGADVIVTMLPDSPDVEAVLLSEAGVLHAAEKGSLIIDASSVAPRVSRDVERVARDMGIDAVDAPVSGGEQGAKDASLSIMVGGSDSAFERAQTILRALGTSVVHVGPAGAGQTVKAANQLMVAGHLQVLAEALRFLEAHGVDTQAALHVLAGGLAGSTVLDRKGAAMIAREFQPGFRIALHDKDLRNFSDAAREVGSAAPIGALLAQLFAAANAQGDGALDHSAMYKLVDRLSRAIG